MPDALDALLRELADAVVATTLTDGDAAGEAVWVAGLAQHGLSALDDGCDVDCCDTSDLPCRCGDCGACGGR